MSKNEVALTGDDIIELIEDLAYNLPGDKYYRLVLCGGGALCIYYPECEYEVTYDGDVFDYTNETLPDSLISAIEKVALNDESEIGTLWLNDAIVRHDDSNYEHNLTVSEYISFIENYDSPDYFYNENGDLVIELYHLSLLGIIASKSVANRNKDVEALDYIVHSQYNTFQDIVDDFQKYALSFIGSPRYETMLKHLREIFEN